MRIIILMLYAALGYAVYVFVRGYFSSVEEGRPEENPEDTISEKGNGDTQEEPVTEDKSPEIEEEGNDEPIAETTDDTADDNLDDENKDINHNE